MNREKGIDLEEDGVNGWRYVVVLVGTMGITAAAIHIVWAIRWYEALMGGLLIGVLVVVGVFIGLPEWASDLRTLKESLKATKVGLGSASDTSTERESARKKGR